VAGAPAKAREGESAAIKGVAVAAGLHPRWRLHSSRATSEDLWAPLDMAATPAGRTHLWATSSQTTGAADTKALERFSSFLAQARSLYLAAEGMDIRARPLVSYYALLNLAKAWLTLVSPTTTVGLLMHGAQDVSQVPAGQYITFGKEQLSIKKSGVLPEIAKRTGVGHVVNAPTTFKLLALLPLLPEALEEVEADGPTPALLPLVSLEAWSGKALDNGVSKKALWLRAEVDDRALAARGLSRAALPKRANYFGSVFALRQSATATATYESAPIFTGPNVNHGLPALGKQFVDAFLSVSRGSEHRYYAVLTTTPRFSQEALTFAVMHHLSNMVRYRPAQLDRLATTPRAWLLSTWVPRALENSLLTYAGRILDREVRLQ
jgi:hypothetical protein